MKTTTETIDVQAMSGGSTAHGNHIIGTTINTNTTGTYYDGVTNPVYVYPQDIYPQPQITPGIPNRDGRMYVSYQKLYVDLSKVETFEDLKKLFMRMNMRISIPIDDIDGIEHLLVGDVKDFDPKTLAKLKQKGVSFVENLDAL